MSFKNGLLLTLLALAGCGGGGGESPTSTPPIAASPPATEAAVPEVKAVRMAAIAKAAGYNTLTGSSAIAKAAVALNPITSDPATTNKLTVLTNGVGTVTSDQAGINCGAACTAVYQKSTTVTLTAIPPLGYTFMGWMGDCSGLATMCTVSMSTAHTVTASFSSVPTLDGKANCVFDWAERTFPSDYFPAAQSVLINGYYARHYTGTNTYLAMFLTNSHIYFVDAQNMMYDYGSIATYIDKAGCGNVTAVTPPAVAAPDLAWTFVPTTATTPGSFAAFATDSVKSSVILKLTRNGVPVVGEAVSWATSDMMASLQPVAGGISDADGLVKAWYITGVQPQQVITARHINSGKTLSTTVTRASPPNRVAGTYVAMWADGPVTSIPYTGIAVTAIPGTTPPYTYYSLLNIFRTDGSFASYGGLQQLGCPNNTNATTIALCATTRGAYTGRGALFSSWDWISPSGQVYHPLLVNAPAASTCMPFSHEGSGMSCFAKLDWAANETWKWSIETIPGAPANYQRMRTTAYNLTKNVSQEIATVDMPGPLNMRSPAMFNENWQPTAPNCIDVETRKLTITSIKFTNSQGTVKATNALGMGMAGCRNYAFIPNLLGIELSSGGNTFFKVTDILSYNPTTKVYTFPQGDAYWHLGLDISKLN